MLDILSMEEKYSKQVKLEMRVLEEAEKAAKIKNKEKLIDDLMFGEADANQILADHRWTGDGIFWNGEFIVGGCGCFCGYSCG